MSSSYPVATFGHPTLPTPTPSPTHPHSSSSNTYHVALPQHHQPQLSLFEQTLREEEEQFYRVFPNARQIASHDQNPPTQPEWRVTYNTHVFAGTNFHLQNIAQPNPPRFNNYPSSNNEQALQQAFSQSSPAYAVGPASLGHHQPTLHNIQLPQSHHMGYVTPKLSPTQLPPQPFTSVPPLVPQIVSPAHDIMHQSQYPQIHHQSLPEPIMDSLPSPATSSDTSTTFHNTPQYPSSLPQQAYHQSTPPFTAISSPVHHEFPTPLSPPALVQATYTHNINAVNPKPDPQSFFVDVRPPPPQPPQQNTSIAPSRRNSRDASTRSQRRHSPPYARPHHTIQRSGRSRGANSIPSPNMGWSPNSQSSTVSSMSGNSNVNVGVFVNANANDAAPVATQHGNAAIAPASTTVPSSTSPGSSHSSGSSSSKRNPDKKPALACIFCRGRKIACGPPPKDGDGKTCNQCHRRSLRCEYPTESRRGMRKRPSTSGSPTTTSGSSLTPTTSTSKANNNSNATGNPKPKTKPDPLKVASSKKR